MALSQVTGTYGLAILYTDQPNRIYAIRRGSPLLLSTVEDGIMIASDPHAFPSKDLSVIPMGDGELAMLSRDGTYTIESATGETIIKEAQKLDIFQENTTDSRFAHAMLSEIFEQPEVIENTVRGRINFETEQVTL